MKKTLISLLCLMTALCLMLSCAALGEGSPDDVLVTVNGTPITRGEVDGKVLVYTLIYTNQGYDVSSEEGQKTMRAVCLRDAVSNELIVQNAFTLNAELTDEEIAANRQEMEELWDGTALSAAKSAFGLTDDTSEEEKAAIIARVEESMTQSLGYTRESLVSESLVNLRTDKVIAALCGDLSISDADMYSYLDSIIPDEQATIQDFVDSYQCSFVEAYEYYNYLGYSLHFTPEGYRGVIQILLPVEEELLTAYKQMKADADASSDQVEEARQAVIASVQLTIDEINEKFAAGVSFADLISEYNTDPGMNDAANLANGYKVHKNSIMYDPAFVDAAFSVDEIGQMSGPFPGEYGIYIVYYLRDIPAGAVELTDELRAEIENDVRDSRKAEILNNQLDAWNAEAEIVYTDAAADYRFDFAQ